MQSSFDQQSKRCSTCGKHLVADELRPKIGSSKMVCDTCLLEKEGQQLHQMRHKYGRPHQVQQATKAGTLFKGATASKLPHNLGHPQGKTGKIDTQIDTKKLKTTKKRLKN